MHALHHRRMARKRALDSIIGWHLFFLLLLLQLAGRPHVRIIIFISFGGKFLLAPIICSIRFQTPSCKL